MAKDQEEAKNAGNYDKMFSFMDNKGSGNGENISKAGSLNDMDGT